MKLKIIIISFILLLYGSIFIYSQLKEDDVEYIPPQEIIKENIMINNNKYDTLQAAIDASNSGDTIEIYQDIIENVKIENKVLHINGNNNTIISSQYIGTSINTLKSVIEINDSNVTISNLNIDGDIGIDKNLSNIGIYINNSTIELNNISIININHQIDKLSNYPNGTGIYITNDLDVDNYVKISDCKISNFHHTAIYINNHSINNLNVEITNNEIKGIGITNQIIQKGIYIKGLVSGLITMNNIIDINYLNLNNNENTIIVEDSNSNIDVLNNLIN